MQTNRMPQLGEMMLPKVKDGLVDPVVVLSVLLASLGIWVLLPEILIGRASTLSHSQAGAARVVAASRIAVIRGDLWADAAEIFESRLQASTARTNIATFATEKEHLATACRNSLSLAPVSPRLWALCAPYCSDRDRSDCVTRYVEMAYFTGPYRPEAIADRLRTAMTIDFGRSPDIKMLVAEDIRFILSQETTLKPDLISSYRDALASNKQIILTQIKEIDPTFAAILR